MHLERLRIAGYRSLYDVQLLPRHLTVLTGPNNSGKTNFVESVDFVAEAYRHGLELAINRKGGIENIAHRRMRRTRRPMSFDIIARLEPGDYLSAVVRSRKRNGFPKDVQVLLRHQFAIAAKSQAIEADFEISDERIDLIPVHRPPKQDIFFVVEEAPAILSIARTAHGFSAMTPDVVEPDSLDAYLVRPFDRDDLSEMLVQAVSPTRLLTEDFSFNPVIRRFSASMGATRLFQLVPLECRKPGVPTPNAEVNAHGENLPALVAWMRKHEKRAWERVLDAMRRIVPGLEDVRTEHTPDRRLALQFVERGVGRAWTSDDISDGTIQSLALFCALFDRRTPMVLIEEPENSVHPWILRNFIDACRESERKRVVITTHSPVLLSYVTPDDIFVVWRQDGKTNIETLAAIDPDARTLWESGKSSLFEILDSGFLPQSVPSEIT